MCDILMATDWLGIDLRLGVCMDIGELFANSAHSIASHGDMWGVKTRKGEDLSQYSYLVLRCGGK